MKAQFEVDEILWGKVRVASLLKSKSIGELLTPILEREFGGQGGFEGLPKKDRKQPKVKSEELVEVQSPASDNEAPEPIPEPLPKEAVAWVGVPVDPSEVPMAKCRKCGEPFRVADMITEPKSGKLFCRDCVDDLKNGQ